MMHKSLCSLPLIIFYLLLISLVKATDPNVRGSYVDDLFETDTTLFETEAARWTASGLLGTTIDNVCSTIIHLGGPGILGYGGYFERTYTGLVPHDIVSFIAKFTITDTWSAGQSLVIQIGGKTVANWQFAGMTGTTNYCGQSSAYDIDPVRPIGKVFHNDTSITVRVTSNINPGSTAPSFGFRSLALTFGFKSASDVESCCAGSTTVLSASFACPCNAAYYYNGVTCKSCNVACRECYGPGADQCYGCDTGYGFDGTSCVQCDPSCTECIGSTSSDCVICPTNTYHYWDNTCRSTCSGSYVSTTGAYNDECVPSCSQANQWTLWDNTCSATCDAPLVQSTIGGVQFCNFPCTTSPNIYAMPDGSCVPSCTLPYIATTYQSKHLCVFKCSAPTPYYYPDTSCQAACDSPFTVDTQTIGLFCTSGCSATVPVLYYDQSCQATCPATWTTYTLGGVQVCINSCSDPNKFFYNLNQSCVSSCDSPLKQTTQGSVKYCDLPCASNEFYYQLTGSCLTACATPSTQTNTSNGYMACIPACSNPAYYYLPSTTTCQATCSYPYEAQTVTPTNLCNINLSQNDLEQINQINSIANSAQTASGVTAILSALLSSGDPGAMGAAALVKMLQYMRFLNIKYPAKLYLILASQKIVPVGVTFSPKITTDIAKGFDYETLPDVFEATGVHSKFVVNCWELIISVAIIFVVILLIFILAYFAQNSPKIQPTVQKVKTTVKWNFMLTIFCSNYGDIALYSVLELTTLSLDSFLSVLSFFICIAFNGFAAFVLFKAIQITLEYRKVLKGNMNSRQRKIKHLQKKWESYDVLFSGFYHTSMFQQMFTFGFVVRAYALNIIVGSLYDHPVIQTVIMTLMSCGMILYLSFKLPMTKTLNNIQQMILEILVLIINVCLLTLSRMDEVGNESEHPRAIIGETIICLNLAISFICSVFLVLKIVMIIRELYLAHKAEKAEKAAQEAATLKKAGISVQQPRPLRPSLQAPILHQPSKALRTAKSPTSLNSGRSNLSINPTLPEGTTYVGRTNSDLPQFTESVFARKKHNIRLPRHKH